MTRAMLAVLTYFLVSVVVADEIRPGVFRTPDGRFEIPPPEDVAKVRPDAETLQAYHDAVYERTKEVLSGLTAADMDRELDEPQYSPLPTVGVRLASVISDNTQHAGQAAYIKGLAQGKHWMGV